VKNNGAATSAATTVDIHLSTNAVLDGGDPLVTTLNVPALAPGAEAILPYSPAVTWTVGSGRIRNFIANVDPSNTVGESNETNNTRARSVGLALTPYDVSGDGGVAIVDALLVNLSLSATSASTNWNPDADLDGNGTVTSADTDIALAHFGDTASHVEAHLNAAPVSGMAALTVTFAYDAHFFEGSITNAQIDFDGDGTWDHTVNGPATELTGTVQHTFNTPGTYVPKIRSLDVNNFTDNASGPTITVSSSAGVETLRPTANGGYQEWGEVFGSGTTHWDRVEEVTADDLGSYIFDNSWNGTERDTYQLSDTTLTDIASVEVCARAARISSNDNNNVRLMIRSGSSDAESGVKTLSTSWTTVCEVFALDPATGQQWTQSGVNSLQAGVRNAMGPSGGGGVGVTQVYAVVRTAQVLRPTANGTHQEWGEVFGSGTTHWDRVEETTADDSGSYIFDNSWNGTERDTYQLSDTSFTTISSVLVCVRAARITTNDNNNVRVMIRSNTTDAQSASPKTLSSTWTTVCEAWNNDPATGSAWTPSAVNALQAGMRNAMGPSGGGGVGVTQVYVVVGGN
jgi:hypothetical protein